MMRMMKKAMSMEKKQRRMSDANESDGDYVEASMERENENEGMCDVNDKQENVTNTAARTCVIQAISNIEENPSKRQRYTVPEKTTTKTVTKEGTYAQKAASGQIE